MKRRRVVVAAGSLCGGAAACAAVAMILAGCPNTATTTVYTPPTGIQIDSQQLVAGIGCGSGPGQVYRYAAVVGPPAPDGGPGIAPGATAYTSAVSDCFSDTLFQNLPSPDGGAAEFGVNIYAFDFATFPSALGGCENLPLTALCPGDDAAVVHHYESQATWTTTCTATQYQGVPQFAVCGELLPSDGGIRSDGGDAAPSSDAADAAETSDGPSPVDGADGSTAEASDGAGVSGEGGDAPLE